MVINQVGSTTVATQEKKTIKEFIIAFKEKYPSFERNNVIVNLFSLDDLRAEDILPFEPISNSHKTTYHSFVIVSNKLNFDDIPAGLDVVPTLQEAHDLIEMEEIERDLGL